MSLRSWAFAGRKTFVAAVLGCLYLAFAGTEIWVVATDAQQRDSGTIYPYTKNLGCFRSKVEDDLEIATKTSVLFIAASAIDLCCIIITWLHCLKIRSTQGSLGRIFLVQGAPASLLTCSEYCLDQRRVLRLSLARNDTCNLGGDGDQVASIMRYGILSYILVSQRAAIFSGGFLLPVPLVLCNMVACRLVLHVRRRANPTETQISYRISNIVRNDLAFIEESPFVSKTSTLVA
ncbi:hypothetical protein F5887DRAFT_1071194 [Amanita rubescens]|nr:hypothetical protein F5887DRAFT_1071194 [Amanita rubescens]